MQDTHRAFVNATISTAFCLLAWLIPAVGALAMSAEEAARRLEALTWYSEEYPPYNFKSSNGQPTGIAVDILMAAFKKIGAKITPDDIKIVPWNRGYKYIQNKPGTALFSMTYTPERQKIMKFVGPSAPSNISVIVPKASEKNAGTAADLNKLTIGVVRDDVGDQLIRHFAVSDSAIVRKNSLKQLLYLLNTGRVDGIAYAVSVFNFAVKRSGRNPKNYRESLVLKKGQVGYAFHNATDSDVLAPLQKAIDELAADGTIDRINAKYGN